jgi:hypothetical protein
LCLLLYLKDLFQLLLLPPPGSSPEC